MNYSKIYYSIISSGKNLNRKKKNGRYESHHIIPKSLGGSDDPSNLVVLTPREHFIAHRLLVKMQNDPLSKQKMSYAFLMMCACNPNQKRIVSSYQYECAKRYVSENCSGKNHHSFGSTMSEERKSLMSQRMTGASNPQYGKPSWNKGLTKENTPSLVVSSETRQKLSKIGKGRLHTLEAKSKMSKSMTGIKKSESHKNKLSESLKGKKLSAETILKIKERRTGVKQKIVNCPHCELSGGVSTMKRWHFEKCKSLMNKKVYLI